MSLMMKTLRGTSSHQFVFSSLKGNVHVLFQVKLVFLRTRMKKQCYVFNRAVNKSRNP